MKPKPWALYWCSTEGQSEDAFVVARGATAAAEFFEGSEGFDTGDANAEYVRLLPRGLDVHRVGYADDTILKRCGARLGRRGTIRLCGRTYRGGDIVRVAFRAIQRQRRDELRAARLLKRREAI